MPYNKKTEEKVGYTGSMQKERTKSSFSIGDTVEVDSGNGKWEVAVIERFFPFLVLLRRSNNTTFTLRYSDMTQARLVKGAGFQVHSEKMDQEELLRFFKNRKIGDPDGGSL